MAERRRADVPHPLSVEQRAVLTRLVRNPIYELIPLPNARERAAALPPAARVTVTVSVRLGLDATLDLGVWLAAHGHDVSPHVAARLIRDRAHLLDVLDRARNASIRKLFVVGGDGPPSGEFPDGLALLRALHEVGHPFDEIGVPAYPEGHVHIPADVLVRDLREKQAYADVMTTQMSFNPTAVDAWTTHVRRDHILLPIHLGIPGAVPLPRLMRIASRIGVAESSRYLMKHRSLLGHLLHGGSFGPDAFLLELARTLIQPTADVRALHIFTMNEVAATVDWQRRLLENLGG